MKQNEQHVGNESFYSHGIEEWPKPFHHQHPHCPTFSVMWSDPILQSRYKTLLDPVLNKSINDVYLSARARNALSSMDIHTIGDLIERSEYNLYAVKNIGVGTLAEIKRMLLEHGYVLRQN